MRTSEAGASWALLVLLLLRAMLLLLLLLLRMMLLLLVREKVGLELLLAVVEKDGCLEAGVGVIGSAVLAFPRFGGGLGDPFLLRNERRRMKRGLLCES
jgi:hypothetical protein